MAEEIQVSSFVQMDHSDNHKIENEYMTLRLEEGIIICEFKKQLSLTMDIARKTVQDRLKLSNGINRPLFADMRDLTFADQNVRKYMAGEEAVKFISAGAFLVESPVTQFLMRLFLTLNRPARPAKAFTDKAKAIEWLKQYR